MSPSGHSPLKYLQHNHYHYNKANNSFRQVLSLYFVVRNSTQP